MNNRYALERIQKHIGLSAILFEGEYWLTKQIVADFFEVEERTIERYLEKHAEELSSITVTF